MTKEEIQKMIDDSLAKAFAEHNKEAHEIKLKMIAEGLIQHVKDFHGSRVIR